MVIGGIERAARMSATYATLAAFAAFCLFPFLWMVDTALKPPDEVRSLNPPSSSYIRRWTTFAMS
jgi:multiple sugar transport system permease protein